MQTTRDVLDSNNRSIASETNSSSVSALTEVHNMLLAQRDSYRAGSVRWAVVEKSLSLLAKLEKRSPESYKPAPPPKHRLHGTPCPACARSLATTSRGDVVCQNGHRQP